MRSLLASRYVTLEIPVVDDGSTDRTAAIVENAFASELKTSPAMDLSMLWTATRALIGHASHPTQAEIMNSAFVQTLYYYGLFLAINVATATLAFPFEPYEDWRLLIRLPLQRFFYRQMIYYVAIKSFATALRGPRVGWGKQTRYGSVQSASELNESNP